ncbi:unnamed protein product [Notodromas monacha]|uniref:RRM domain-containing protein n=1 Tax=Notodromas monacha TaxID=399045 RepID=A0A7R9BIS0_9CRUS|nr:unnamed protein product [Notodromas monacha]CAG0915168.1 unnamed protein product [Notodromas monacha]
MKRGNQKAKSKTDGLEEEEILARTHSQEVRLLEDHYAICRRVCNAPDDRPRKTVRVNPRAVVINDIPVRSLEQRNEPRRSILKSATMEEQRNAFKHSREDPRTAARRLRSVYLRDAATQMTPPHSLMTLRTDVSNYPADETRTKFSGEDDETTAADVETLTCESTRLRISPTRRSWLCPPSTSSSASTVPMSSITQSNARPRTSSESDTNTKQKTVGFGSSVAEMQVPDKTAVPAVASSVLNAFASSNARFQAPTTPVAQGFHSGAAGVNYNQLISSAATAAAVHRLTQQQLQQDMLQQPGRANCKDILQSFFQKNWASNAKPEKLAGFPNVSATNEVATNAQGDFSQSVSENTSKDISNMSSKSSKTLDWCVSEMSSRNKTKLEFPLLGEGQQWGNPRLTCCGNSSSFLVPKRTRSRQKTVEIPNEETKMKPTTEELMNAIVSAQRASDILGRAGIDVSSCDWNWLQNIPSTLKDEEKLVKLLLDFKNAKDDALSQAVASEKKHDNSCSSKHSATQWAAQSPQAVLNSARDEPNQTQSADSLLTLFPAQNHRESSQFSQKPVHQTNQSRSVDPTNLYFANLPKNVRDCDLIRLVEEFGPVVSAKLMENPALKVKGVGFVRMKFQQDCDRVIKAFNGKTFPGTKKILSVKLAWKSKDTDNASVSSLYTPMDYNMQHYKSFFGSQPYPNNGAGDPRMGPWSLSDVYQPHGVPRTYPFYASGMSNSVGSAGVWVPAKDQAEYLQWSPGSAYVPNYNPAQQNIEYAVLPGADVGDGSWGLWGMEPNYHAEQGYFSSQGVPQNVPREQSDFDPAVYQSQSGFPAGFPHHAYYPLSASAGYFGLKPPVSSTNFSGNPGGNAFYQTAKLQKPFMYANGMYNGRPSESYFRLRERDENLREALQIKQDSSDNCDTYAMDVSENDVDKTVGKQASNDKMKFVSAQADKHVDGGPAARSPHTISMKKPGVHSQLDSTWRSSGDGPRRQGPGLEKQESNYPQMSAAAANNSETSQKSFSSTRNHSGDLCPSTTTMPESDSSRIQDKPGLLQEVNQRFLQESDEKAQGDVLRNLNKTHRRDGSDGGAAAGTLTAA